MKVIIITSFEKGTASHHLSYLNDICGVDIIGVILNKKRVKKTLLSKVKKAFNIGLFGALNGVRLRKWYQDNMYKEAKIDTIYDVCDQLNVNLYEVHGINTSNTIELLKNSNVDLGISLGNGFIKKEILDIPKKGFINVHHELLPEYQNSQSIIWQLYNMSNTTGYTIHKMNDKIDEGEILLKESIKIIFKESLSKTVTSTYCELLKNSVKGLKKVLTQYDYYDKSSYKQKDGNKYTTPSIAEFIKIYFNYRKLKKQDEG